MLADASKNKGDPAGWEKLKALPSFFDASDIVVEQHFVNSKDGTKIPYFQVGSAKAAAGPNSPTLLCTRTHPASVTACGLFVTVCGLFFCDSGCDSLAFSSHLRLCVGGA